MSSWAEIVNRVPVNLQGTIPEEVTKDSKVKKCIDTVQPQVEFDVSPELLEGEIIKSDGEIAKKLQEQFDKEHNENLRKSKNKSNGAAKESVSYFNCQGVSDNVDCESEEETELEDIGDQSDWDRLDALQKDIYCIPRGYVINNGKMIAKRDLAMIKRKGGKFFSKHCKKHLESLKERHKILDNKKYPATAIDDSTRFLLYKMITTELIENVTGIVNTGKEKVVLHANSGPQYTTDGLQREWAIKVFKTSLSEYTYIIDYHRFKDRYGIQNIRKMKHLWVVKDMDNLLRARKAGVRCPAVVGRKNHILVMSFIGKDGTPAPKLSDAPMSDLDYIDAYCEVVEQMKRLYDEVNLIHIDLSEYKILWFDGHCYFYDLSEAVEPTHGRAYHLLMEGCVNITNFFNSKNVPNVRKACTLLEYISGTDWRFTSGPLKHAPPKVKPRYTFSEAWKKSRKGELHFGNVHT